MIPITHTKPAPHTLGGVQFFGHDGTLLTVQADASRAIETPIMFHVCSGKHRTMLDLSTEEAETLAACLATAIRLRREAEATAKAATARQAKAHFMDSDGLLEAA